MLYQYHRKKQVCLLAYSPAFGLTDWSWSRRVNLPNHFVLVLIHHMNKLANRVIPTDSFICLFFCVSIYSIIEETFTTKTKNGQLFSERSSAKPRSSRQTKSDRCQRRQRNGKLTQRWMGSLREAQFQQSERPQETYKATFQNRRRSSEACFCRFKVRK